VLDNLHFQFFLNVWHYQFSLNVWHYQFSLNVCALFSTKKKWFCIDCHISSDPKHLVLKMVEQYIGQTQGHNQDVLPFNDSEKCCSGGLYITQLRDYMLCQDECGKWARRAMVSDQALVYVEKHKLKYTLRTR